MYSNSYSRTTFGLEAKDIHKSKGKSCGYYMRIVFFFSSLIQSLIIVSLVLFLVYGQPEKTAEEKRVEELQQGFKKISDANVLLRQEKAELSAGLKAKTDERNALEKERDNLKTKLTTAEKATADQKLKTDRCETDKRRIEMTRSTPVVQQCPTVSNTAAVELKNLRSLNEQQKAMHKLTEANYTSTVKHLKAELELTIKDKNKEQAAGNEVRQENTDLKKQLEIYTTKCKEDFAKSLEGIQTVTSTFLTKIDTMFPSVLTFHLTCEKQQEQMDRIRNSCTNLSRQVENKFQSYLDHVGEQVTKIQKLSSHLEVVNARLTTNLLQCNQSHSLLTTQGSRKQMETQENHDSQFEQLLKEKNQLREAKEQLEKQIATLRASPTSCPQKAPTQGSGGTKAPQRPARHVLLTRMLIAAQDRPALSQPPLAR